MGEGRESRLGGQSFALLALLGWASSRRAVDFGGGALAAQYVRTAGPCSPPSPTPWSRRASPSSSVAGASVRYVAVVSTVALAAAPMLIGPFGQAHVQLSPLPLGFLRKTCAADSPSSMANYPEQLAKSAWSPLALRLLPRFGVRPTPYVTDARPVETATLWEGCLPVTADDEVGQWLSDCRIDPAAVASLDLARALPRGVEVPPWARFGGNPWNADGYRLLVPLYSALGELESLYARALRPITGGLGMRISFPLVHGPIGLLMADASGRALLRRAAWPQDADWRTIIITGGAVDFLDWATAAWLQAPVVLGIVPGSWTHEVAARIPDDSRVIVRAHANPITGRYAHRVEEALRGRCEVIVRTAS